MSDREKLEVMYQEILEDLVKVKKRLVDKIRKSDDVLVDEADSLYKEYRMLLEQKCLFEIIFVRLDEES